MVWSPKSTNEWAVWQLMSVLPDDLHRGRRSRRTNIERKCLLCVAAVKNLELRDKRKRVSWRWSSDQILIFCVWSWKLTNLLTSWQLKQVRPTVHVVAGQVYHMFRHHLRFSRFMTRLLPLTVQVTKEAPNSTGLMEYNFSKIYRLVCCVG